MPMAHGPYNESKVAAGIVKYVSSMSLTHESTTEPCMLDALVFCISYSGLLCRGSLRGGGSAEGSRALARVLAESRRKRAGPSTWIRTSLSSPSSSRNQKHSNFIQGTYRNTFFFLFANNMGS